MKEDLNIVLLEDNETDAEIIKRLLQRTKQHVKFAVVVEREEYIKALDTFQPDVILSDHSLPQFSSTEALEIIQQRKLQIPFILVTGTVSDEFAVKVMKMGADDYLLKDRLTRLPAAIDAAFERRKAEREKLEAEKKILESQLNLKTIFENTTDGFLLMDVDGRVKVLNRNSARYGVMAINKEIKVGDSIYDFIEDDRRELFTANMLKVLAGEKIQYERSFNFEDGDIKWIEVSIIPVITNAKVEGICINGRDITEYKKIELEREFDRNNLAALINNTEDFLWSVDRGFKVITFNNSFATYVKRPSGKPMRMGASILKTYLDPGQSDRFKEYYERAFNGESFTEIEHYHQVWSEISFYPIRNDINEIVGTACFCRDITQRKKIEEIAQNNFAEKKVLAERMSTILNSLPANIALLDKHGVIIDVNDSWRNFADKNGFTGSNYCIGDNYIKITAAATGAEAKDGKNVSAGIKSVLNNRESGFEYEYPCHSATEERWFRMIVTPLEKEKGGVVVMHLNITEQKKSATALEVTLKELSDYKIALDESSIVSITNHAGIITYVNSNFCKISKYSAEELLGKNHRVVSSSFHDKDFIKNLWATISAGKIWRNEVRNKAKDGEIYWVDATIVPFLDKKGNPVQYVAINRDITEKKLIEQELVKQKVEEQKRVTRAMMTAQENERNHLSEELHDNVNQILAGTKLYLGMIGQDKPELKDLLKYPSELIDSTIAEIRSLCHWLSTPPKNVDLNQMVKDLLETFSKSTSIKSGFTYSVTSLVLDDDLKLNIYRIIQEQINNIVKYARAKNVNISIIENNKVLEIITKDDGVGFNVNAKRKGIGIYNMMHRISSYNGEINIISSPGKGCTIAISIPG